MHDGKLCIHDDILDAIDMLEMYTLNLIQFTNHTRTLTDEVSPHPLPDKKMPSWAVVRDP